MLDDLHETEEMAACIKILSGFCESLSKGCLGGDRYLEAECWLRLSREILSLFEA